MISVDWACSKGCLEIVKFWSKNDQKHMLSKGKLFLTKLFYQKSGHDKNFLLSSSL